MDFSVCLLLKESSTRFLGRKNLLLQSYRLQSIKEREGFIYVYESINNINIL